MLRKILLTTLLTSPLMLGDIPQGGVAIDVKSQQKTSRTLGNTVIEIRITNKTDHEISIETLSAVPPVFVDATDFEGNDLIKRSLVKAGKSVDPMTHRKSARFSIDPGETKTYRKTVRELLSRGDTFNEPARGGTVTLKVSLPIVTIDSGAYTANVIASNPVQIEISQP